MFLCINCYIKIQIDCWLSHFWHSLTSSSLYFVGFAETGCPFAQELPRRGKCVIGNLYWHGDRRTCSSAAFQQCILWSPIDIRRLVLLPLSVPFSSFFAFAFPLKSSSLSLSSLLSAISCSFSCHYLISPLSSPSFLRSALLLIFCPIHEVL